MIILGYESYLHHIQYIRTLDAKPDPIINIKTNIISYLLVSIIKLCSTASLASRSVIRHWLDTL